MFSAILGMFNVFAPVILDMVATYQKQHKGQLPTEEQLRVIFESHIDEYLAEGDAWKAKKGLA